MIGQRLAHYDVLEKIGSGGMGEIYRARDTKLDRDVALKILPAAVADDPERRARFETESRAVAALRHPNIVTIHAIEEADGVRFMAMELVEGQTLSQAIPAGGFPLNRFLDIAIPLTDAVAAAHAKGITHRDLKPDNVMIEPDGRLKVLDFGLAKLLEVTFAGDGTMTAGPRATQEGRILGTVAYMSPEQAEGKPVDPRSDVFSLGIVLYEMITGERPFHGDTHISTITSILRDTAPPVHERKRSVPRQLDRIVQRCLEKSPDKRYESARGLRNDLESLRIEETSQSSAPAPADAPKKSSMTLWLIGGIALAAIAGAAWFMSRGPKSAAPEAATAATAKPAMIVVFPFENMGPAGDQYFAAGIAEEITSRLSALQGLGVVSRTSATQYDRKGKTMQKIAADLGVDYVLDGTVRWARNNNGTSAVRITPQLIRAKEDRQVWSASYDRAMDEIFRIQSEIASEVVDKLGMAVAAKDRDALTAAPTTSVEAYHEYLEARSLINTIAFSNTYYDRAIALLEAACAKDPKFVRAYGELAAAHAGMVHFAWDTSEERLARSKAAADRALAIDPSSPWAQLGLGYYYYWGRKDYENASVAFAKASSGLPSSGEPLAAMAYVRRRQGKWQEAADEIQKATSLDPRNAMLFFTLGETHMVLRRYPEAISSTDRAVTMSTDKASGYTLQSRLAVLSGDIAGARASLAKAAAVTGTSSEIRTGRVWNAIDCREFDQALRLTDSLPEAANSQFRFECRSAERGWIMALSGNRKGAQAEFERALPLLEAYVRTHPDESNVRSALAGVLAHLGRHDEALREAQAALTVRPASHDAWIRQFRQLDLAMVETFAGQQDAAVRHLEELLSQPSDQVSIALLRLSPRFDTLRENPAFKRLLESRR